MNLEKDTSKVFYSITNYMFRLTLKNTIGRLQHAITTYYSARSLKQ